MGGRATDSVPGRLSAYACGRQCPDLVRAGHCKAPPKLESVWRYAPLSAYARATRGPVLTFICLRDVRYWYVSAYARATRCLVLTRVSLRACYATSGTNVHQPTRVLRDVRVQSSRVQWKWEWVAEEEGGKGGEGGGGKGAGAGAGEGEKGGAVTTVKRQGGEGGEGGKGGKWRK
eukprot:3399843-Rhodomonas_salina.2